MITYTNINIHVYMYKCTYTICLLWVVSLDAQFSKRHNFVNIAPIELSSKLRWFSKWWLSNGTVKSRKN